MTRQLRTHLPELDQVWNETRVRFIWFWTNRKNSVTHFHIFSCKYDRRLKWNHVEFSERWHTLMRSRSLADGSNKEATVRETKLNHQPGHFSFFPPCRETSMQLQSAKGNRTDGQIQTRRIKSSSSWTIKALKGKESANWATSYTAQPLQIWSKIVFIEKYFIEKRSRISRRKKTHETEMLLRAEPALSLQTNSPILLWVETFGFKMTN